VSRLSSSPVERSVEVDGLYRVLARPVPRPAASSSAPAAVVVVALGLDPYEDAERRGLYLSLALGLLAVAIAGAGAWAASGYALRQVRRMARRADDWREHDLSGRFDLGAPRDELTELGDTLDRMLDRIAQALLAERRLTDEVAHELRTPLTVIRSEAQLAQLGADASPEAAESLAAILAATERMASSIDTMLAVAREAHRADASCQLGEVLEGVREHGPDRPGVLVDVDDSGLAATVLAAPLQVVQAAVVPLLDNAVRNASSAVRVRASTEGR
jgi:signal transduction histidine kinase